MKVSRFVIFSVLAFSLRLGSLGSEAAVDAERNSFTDFCCDAILDSLNGRTWLLSDGFADGLLVSRAKEKGIDLILMPSRQASDATLDTFEQAVKKLGSPKLDAAAALGTAPFLLVWMQENPDVASAKLALMMDPSLAKAVGLEAIPYGLVYQVVKPADVSTAAVLRATAQYRKIRDSLGEEISTISDDRTTLAHANHIRALAAVCGNNLGYLLYDADQKEEALEVFSLAHSIDKSNTSSLLNKASLVKEGFKPELAEKLGEEMNEMGRRGEGSWSLASTFGYVLKPEEFIPAKWYWAASGIAINNRRGLEAFLTAIDDETLRNAIAQQLASSFAMQIGGAQPAMGLLNEFPEEGFTSQFMLKIAKLQLLVGDRFRAVRIVERAGNEPDANLAEVAEEKARVYSKVGRIADAVKVLMAVKILENSGRILNQVASIHSESGNLTNLVQTLKELGALKDSPVWIAPLLQAVQAQVAGDSARAQKLAGEAVVAGADTDFAFRTALMLDMMASDQLSAAAHVDSLLKLNPMDAFANYVKATLLVEAKQYLIAERHFQISLTQNASWYVMNDYAALAIETQRFDMAEMLARNSLSNGGDRYAAVWDTLGTALQKLNRDSEALAVFKSAVGKEGGDDPRIQLNFGELCLKQGDTATATQTLGVIDKRKDELSVDERERLGRLRSAVGEKNK